jgi:hypothetical protein
MAYKCIIAQSLTSTIGAARCRSPGYLLFMTSAIRLPDVNPAPTNEGPMINPGQIVTSSKSVHSVFIKSQAHFSARVLLFEYALRWSPTGSDQFSSVNVKFYGNTVMHLIEFNEDVRTQRFILNSLQALITARVPSIAGRITSYSFLGIFIGNGDAVCTT